MIEILELTVFDDVELKDYILKTDYFCEFIQMELSINKSEGYQYSFEFNLCDLRGFEKFILNNDQDYLNMNVCALKNYNLLIIKEYNYKVLLDYLSAIFTKAIKQSNDADTIAKRINEYLDWRDYS